MTELGFKGTPLCGIGGSMRLEVLNCTKRQASRGPSSSVPGRGLSVRLQHWSATEEMCRRTPAFPQVPLPLLKMGESRHWFGDIDEETVTEFEDPKESIFSSQHHSV